MVGLFEDDEKTDHFRRTLRRLTALLCPLARAIECLESQHTTPSDVFLFWLAVVAQLNDLFRNGRNGTRLQATCIEDIRRVNKRYSELIDGDRANSLYLVAFVLEPGLFLFLF